MSPETGSSLRGQRTFELSEELLSQIRYCWSQSDSWSKALEASQIAKSSAEFAARSTRKSVAESR